VRNVSQPDVLTVRAFRWVPFTLYGCRQPGTAEVTSLANHSLASNKTEEGRPKNRRAEPGGACGPL